MGNETTLEDLFLRFGVFMHRRFYDREKRRFLIALSQEFEDMGFTTEIKMKKVGAFKVRNLYVGNITRANKIFTTYYDTPTAGNSSYNVLDKAPKKGVMLSSAIPLAAIMIFGVFYIQYFAMPAWSQNWVSLPSILSILVSLILFGLLLHLRRGFGQRNNAIRNTSSILAIIEAARNMDEQQRSKYAFAFTDYGTVNHFGEKLVPYHANDVEQEKTYIMLDSIGSLDELQLLTSANMVDKTKRMMQKLEMNMPSIINLDAPNAVQKKLYKNNVVITAGNKTAENQIVMNTKLNKEYSDKMMENIRQRAKIVLAMMN
ncbi:MAG: hypothetical protein LBV67_05775 [Streptococcaceae bacterium]|nr:hypothetical protein [Streptococcaceae bacterium]